MTAPSRTRTARRSLRPHSPTAARRTRPRPAAATRRAPTPAARTPATPRTTRAAAPPRPTPPTPPTRAARVATVTPMATARRTAATATAVTGTGTTDKPINGAITARERGYRAIGVLAGRDSPERTMSFPSPGRRTLWTT